MNRLKIKKIFISIFVFSFFSIIGALVLHLFLPKSKDVEISSGLIMLVGKNCDYKKSDIYSINCEKFKMEVSVLDKVPNLSDYIQDSGHLNDEYVFYLNKKNHDSTIKYMYIKNKSSKSFFKVIFSGEGYPRLYFIDKNEK